MTTNSVKLGKTPGVYSNIQLWMLVILRVSIGWHFLYEGFSKIYTPGWTSAGYLEVSRWIFADFFKWIAAYYLYPLVLTAIRCGFRRRTLLSLRWKDLDLSNGVWRIPAEFMKTAEDYQAPVPRSVVKELRAYRARLGERCNVGRKSRPIVA